MTRQEFESVMANVFIYYGLAKNKDAFDRVHVDQIFKSFERFPKDRFEYVVGVVYETCSYPPRLAEFMKASEEIKRRGSIPIVDKVPKLDYQPFFPNNEWIDQNMHFATQANPKADPAYVREFMQGLVNVMKIHHKQHTAMMKR